MDVARSSIGVAAEAEGLVSLSAGQLAGRIAEGAVTAREVVEAHIARIEEGDGKWNAVVARRFDAARAEADGVGGLAEASDDTARLGAVSACPEGAGWALPSELWLWERHAGKAAIASANRLAKTARPTHARWLLRAKDRAARVTGDRRIALQAVDWDGRRVDDRIWLVVRTTNLRQT